MHCKTACGPNYEDGRAKSNCLGAKYDAGSMFSVSNKMLGKALEPTMTRIQATD